MATMEEPKTPYSRQQNQNASKDSSSYLMSIITTLSSSADFEQREKEKTRIEKAYRESDKRLGELVTENYQDVTKILQSFNGMTKSINESRDKIRKIKEDLNSCKTLLHFKRDELKKLWKDGVEHKAVLSMLEQVEQIKEVQDKMNTYIANKHYLHATDTIVQAVAMLEGPLNGVEALREVKADLVNIKEKMHETLIEELTKQIYERSVPTSSMQRGSQMRLSRKDASVWGWSDGIDSPKRTLRSDGGDSSNKSHFEVKEDLNSNPEDNLRNFIGILTESLFVLRKLPEAVERLKLGMKGSLNKLINSATQQVAESSGQQLDSMVNHVQPKYLNELLKIVFQQTRCVAQTHQIFLENVFNLTNSGMPLHGNAVYDMKDVWSEIQARLQILLSQYLDVSNTMSSRQQAPSGFDEPSMDISQYFSKRKLAKPKKVSLFRFDASQHAISVSSARQQFEHDALGLSDNWHIIKVCKPGAFNITAIYKPLRSFIQEVEEIMETTSGLQEFITEFVQNAFLGQVHARVSDNIDTATRVLDGDDGNPYISSATRHRSRLSSIGFDALRNVIDEKTRRELGVPRPLLQSTVTVDSSIQELQSLMHSLPDYADQFLNMICNVLRDYRDKCNSAYRDIVQHGSDEKRIISAMWAKDEDISRFLRSLPSWRSLQPRQGKELDRTICSEEEIRALNSKEAVILISNLSSDESLIPQQEIITDVTQMRTVANVHESLEWFGDRLDQFCGSLTVQGSLSALQEELPASQSEGKKKSSFDQEMPPISEKTLESLKLLVQDFKDLAEICLLLLHLEVRVHCFYYLLPVAKQSNYAGPIDDLDPDSNVLKLNKDLSSMEEMMTQSLQPKKFKYIFESLGYLVASILITSVQFLKKINENGIKKMCRNILAIQQNLTNITLTRESDLDRARHFYEMLYLNPDDVLNSVAEKGPQFTLNEYQQLIHLYHRSFAGNPVSVQDARMQRLQSVMEKGQDETV